MKKKLKIDILANDGSPLGTHLSDVYGKNERIGLGGAELALHTLCEAWHNNGHRVRLYNNPTIRNGSPYGQYPIDTFIPQENRDVVIVFRSPNHRIEKAKGLKIWFSCDQYTIGNFADFSKQVDKIVTISPFHAKYFQDVYGIENTFTIDLPVRTWDYENLDVEKIPHRMIFCSVPDRGLSILSHAYPYIKEQIPDVSLVITSDYRLWGVPDARNEQFIQKFIGMDGVKFLGAVPRVEMVKEQLRADVLAYPCTYQELFCYAVAECQVAGAYPITSAIGSLETTNMGGQVWGDSTSLHWVKPFGDAVIETLMDKHLREKQLEIQLLALERFSLPKILGEWDRIFKHD